MEPSTLRFLEQQQSYVFAPAKWAYDFLRFEPDPVWQESGLDDYINRRFCAWSAGSGVGKSCLLAVIILHFLATRPFAKVACTAPSQHQLFDVLWAEIAKWLRRSPILSKEFVWTATKIYNRAHKEEWFAVARTSRPKPGEITTEGLQGFHADHLLFVVDECSGVADQIVGAVDGALTTKGAHTILASNPTRRSGYFYRTITDTRNHDIWAVRYINAEHAKHVERESIDRIARIYGPDSDYYRIKVLGLPPLTESAAIITPEQVYAAHQRTINPEQDASIKKNRKVLSCDPARFGDDNTLNYIREGLRFKSRHSVHGMETTQVSKILVDLVDVEDVDLVLIDEIGIGAGVFDLTKKLLRRKSSVKVIGIHVGKVANNEDRFFNLRAEIYWALRKTIDMICIPFDTDLLDEELTTIHYKWDRKDTKIQIEPKDDIRARLGRSPNDADSFGINCFPLSEYYDTLGSHVSEKFFAIGSRDSIGIDVGLNRNLDESVVSASNGSSQSRIRIPTAEEISVFSIGSRSHARGAVGASRYAQFRSSESNNRTNV